jgi:uncharacterized iron-regulated membrane protein
VRRTFVKIHLWLGLSVGLLWVIQGLTGSILVFFRDLDHFTGPTAIAGPMASLDTILASVQAAVGGAPIVRLEVADSHRDLINAFYGEHNQLSQLGGHRLHAVVIDAATAKPVGTREDEPVTPFAGSATRWIEMLHMSLLSGRGGEIFIGISGLISLTAALTGLWVAWPPRRDWRSAFSYRRWRTTEHRLYGWHRAVGLTVGLVFLAIAFTGAYMSFEDEVRALMVRVIPHQPAYRPAPVKALRVVISPQQALALAQARFPKANWVRIFMPSTREPVYTVRLLQPGENRVWLGKTMVIVEAASGDVVYVYDALTAPISNRVLDAAFPLHNGELAGLPGRIFVMLVGLAVPALYVTGGIRWLRQRKRTSERVAKLASGPPYGSGLQNQTGK